ncbi:MAG: hypothetical protein J1F35_04580 [Erysipelotrichales bacterium]|nr:hypothetical protein [Erysipelotrichales bacterium]
MEKRGLSVYFIHSAKSDFNNLIYLPVLRSKVLANHTLVFPDSEANKDIYYKDLMDKADLFVVELTSPDTGFNMELKYALMSKKPILALAQKKIGYEEKYQKLLNKVIGYSTEQEIRYFVENFVESYKDKISGGKVDPTLVLGVLN